jgi:hypothetical protein
MRKDALLLTAALTAAWFITATATAQPPGRRSGFDKVLQELKLSERQKQAARTAVVDYQDNVRRLTDLASASLVLELKKVVTQQEFKKLQAATEKARAIRPRPNRNLTENDMVERIMSFDKNNDGKVTKDELPERLQGLIARGDLNKDGALDREEVKKLAANLTREDLFGRGPRGRGARGGAPTGGRLTPAAVERTVDSLKLAGTQKESAAAAIKACKDKVGKLKELARADLLLRMNEVLKEEEFVKFKAAVEGEPTLLDRAVGRDRRPPGRRPPR